MQHPVLPMNTPCVVPGILARLAAIVIALTSSALSAIEGGPVVAGGSYGITRSTIDSGGGIASGGAYVVSGSIAQADADPLQPSSGGSYEITGGFWPGLPPAPKSDVLFQDGFE